MARLLLNPIGSDLDQTLSSDEIARNSTGMAALDAALAAKIAATHDGWGTKYVERVHEKGKLPTRERDRGPQGRRHATCSRSARSSTGAACSGEQAARPGRGRRDVLRADRTVAGRWSSPTTTPSRRARGGRRRPRRSSAPRRWRCGCGCRSSTSSTARAVPARADRASFPGATGAGHIFKKNCAAVGRRRAADRRRVRRLHRGRRLHADHLRSRVHDRAGLHGDRRRGADQGRQEPEPLEPRHRRTRGARAPVGLRRRARARRRDRARR